MKDRVPIKGQENWYHYDIVPDEEDVWDLSRADGAKPEDLGDLFNTEFMLQNDTIDMYYPNGLPSGKTYGTITVNDIWGQIAYALSHQNVYFIGQVGYFDRNPDEIYGTIGQWLPCDGNWEKYNLNTNYPILDDMLIYTKGGVWQLLGIQNYEKINELYGTEFDENDKFCGFSLSYSSFNPDVLYLYSLTSRKAGKQVTLNFSSEGFERISFATLLTGDNDPIKYSNGYGDTKRFFATVVKSPIIKDSLRNARKYSYSYLDNDNPVVYSDVAHFVINYYNIYRHTISPYMTMEELTGNASDTREFLKASKYSWYSRTHNGYVNVQSNTYEPPLGFLTSQELIGRNTQHGYYYNGYSTFSETFPVNYIGNYILWIGTDDRYGSYKFFFDDARLKAYCLYNNTFYRWTPGDTYNLKPIVFEDMTIDGEANFDADNFLSIPGSYFLFYRKHSADSVNRLITLKSLTSFSISSTEQLSDGANICYIYYSLTENTYMALCIDGFHIYSEGDKSINILDNGGLKAYVKGSDTNVEIVTP